MVLAKKSLGQHWLSDEASLRQICRAAELGSTDIVLEIGPGQGSLTKHLVKRAGRVVAVELDKRLAAKLASDATPNLQVVQADILKFDLSRLPADYKVVANIPYYLTSHLLRVLTESARPPAKMVLLVQKEVAERLAARPGQMSLLAAAAQLDYEVELGRVVPAKLFKPPPKVDSQIVILDRRAKPLFNDLDRRAFFNLVKAGFSARRKKLRSALAGGLRLDKAAVDNWLERAGLSGDARAQELDLADWKKLYDASLSKV